MKPLKGIHHVTAITRDAQKNVDFYAGVLGLRLVKKTVNFDDPGSYHLYYGDRFGTPGTLITFFVWPGAERGQPGTGEPIATAFEVPEGSLDWWRKRLTAAGFVGHDIRNVFGAKRLSVSDSDGMAVELVESDFPRETAFWADGGISKDRAIKAIHSVTLALRRIEFSPQLYTDKLKFQEGGTEDLRRRFHIGDSAALSFVDTIIPATVARGRMGAGTIHHVAFRTDDDASQQEWLARLTQCGLHVSPVMDRKYFHSVYFRDPAGVLFEIATDGPGMAVDESAEHLGEALALPAEYESYRRNLEHTLPPISLPQAPVERARL
jgi:glyoxalase family protein